VCVYARAQMSIFTDVACVYMCVCICDVCVYMRAHRCLYSHLGLPQVEHHHSAEEEEEDDHQVHLLLSLVSVCGLWCWV